MEKTLLGIMACFGKEVKHYFQKNCPVEYPKLNATQSRIMRYLFEHHDE